MMRKIICIIVHLFMVICLKAQLPAPDFIYYKDGNIIYNLNTLNNVSTINTITLPAGAGGLAINKNFYSTTPLTTFYTTVNNNYWYYDGTNWVNTGHTAQTVNIGGSNIYMYGYVGMSGNVYRYDGASNDVFVMSLGSAQGPFDVVGDNAGNFFILDTYAPTLTKYSPTGAVLSVYTLVGFPSDSYGGGFAFLDGKFYASIGSTDVWGTITGNTITYAGSLTLLAQSEDFASYPVSIESSISFVGECFNDTTFFTSTITPPADSVLWDFGIAGTTADSSTLLNPSYLYPDTGNYTVTLYSWLANVPDTATEVVHISGKFLTPFPDTVICNGANVVLFETPTQATFLWSNGSTNDSLTVSTASTVWVDVTFNGCTLRDSIEVKYNPFAFSLGNDTSLCPKQTLLLNATYLNAGYQWHDNSTSPTFLVKQSGIYWVDVTVNQCTMRDSVTINYFQGILDIGRDTILCFDTSLYTIYSSPPGISYLWSDGSVKPFLEVKPTGLYWLSMVDLNNCVQYDSVYVTFNTPQVSLGEDRTICLSENLIYNTRKEEFISYHWSTEETNPIIHVNKSGEYAVTITDENHCQASDTVQITVEGCSLFIPNSFTPNGDGIDDEFGAVGENILEYNLKIFNRWGQLVFESVNLNDKWDGTFGNTKADLGVYNYQLRYKFNIHKQTKQSYGTVTLVR